MIDLPRFCKNFIMRRKASRRSRLRRWFGRGGYGKVVIVGPSGGATTRYGHRSRFAPKLSVGDRVQQGQLIGRVGMSGLATGPHLHYEFLVDGVHRDPRTIAKELPRASTIRPTELAAFRRSIRESSLQLASLRSDNQLAMNNSDNPASSTNCTHPGKAVSYTHLTPPTNETV